MLGPSTRITTTRDRIIPELTAGDGCGGGYSNICLLFEQKKYYVKTINCEWHCRAQNIVYTRCQEADMSRVVAL